MTTLFENPTFRVSGFKKLTLLVNYIINLESNALSNAQYIGGEILKVNPTPQLIFNDELEQSICHALSPTVPTVKQDDIHICQPVKSKEIIIKFKGRKQRNDVVFKRKELKSKAVELWALKFRGLLFTIDSICFENQVLSYKCRKLRNLDKLQKMALSQKFIMSLFLRNFKS